jgi:hypothetical protein
MRPTGGDRFSWHLRRSNDERFRSAKLHVVATFSWDPDEWETHAVAMLCHHFGVDKVVPVPDDDQGDRGLDAFTVDGIGYQCYAPEGEPLAPSKRAVLQKGKITTDLKKLDTNREKLPAILGTVHLHTWVLLTPEHKSAAVIEHCNTKAAEVLTWGLEFIEPGFKVQIHSTETYLKAHAFITQTEEYGSFLTAPPDYEVIGADFGAVTSPQIETMDGKLAKLAGLKDDARRRTHRALLLERQLGGDVVLDRIRDRAPDVASHYDSMMDAARAEMIFAAVSAQPATEYYQDVRTSLVERFRRDPYLSEENAEFFADKCITDWLEQCPLDFEESA